MRLTRGARPGVEDRGIVDAGIEQSLPSRTWKAQSNLAVLLANGFARKLASHFRTDDITTVSNARPEMNVDMRGLDSGAPAQALERGLDDSRRHAAPSRVRRGHGAGRREQNGEAIGRRDREHDSRGPGPDTVAFRHRTGSDHLDRTHAVHLGGRRQGLDLEPERRDEAPAVLGDGLRPIGGRATEIE